MANYNLVVNSKFQPFSFERYLQPLQIYNTAYREVGDAIGELSTKASIWERLANDQRDQEVYEQYKAYADDLKAQADLLAREGLNSVNRKSIMEMKTRYGQEIDPIEKAYDYRSKIAEEQRKARAVNPNIMYDVDFSSDVSLKDIIKNPNISYTPVSGDDLYKKGKEAAVAASTRFINPELQTQYWVIRQGYGADAANEFLLNQENIPELKSAVERITSQSGVTNKNKNRAVDYVISGIMSGLTYDEKYQANRDFASKLEQDRLKLDEDRVNLAQDQLDWTKTHAEEEARGLKLPDGRYVKDVGAGRVRVIHPDGRVEILASPASSTSDKSKKTFPGLQFKMWNNDDSTVSYQEGLTNKEWTKDRVGFEESDRKSVPFTFLSKTMQTNLKAKLAEYGLTPEKVDIWVDEDTFTDNHYQVTLKEAEKLGEL